MDMSGPHEKDAPLHRVTSTGSVGSESVYELETLAHDAAILDSTPRPRWWPYLPRTRPRPRGGSKSSYLDIYTPRRRRSLHSRVLRLLTLLPYTILIAIVACAVFFPSYTNPPQRYRDLRDRVLSAGRSANTNNEKIFIAASLYDPDGGLVSGEWGRAVLGLIDILGHDNVFLSIYEDNPDQTSLLALEDFTRRLRCKSAIATEPLNYKDYPHVMTADGRQLLKRIAFLADVRNRALRPLEDAKSGAYHTRFDKLLYLNDVIFDPIDAANLLLSTNVDESSGRTNYRAACAVDFINPFKFYDTFATRDLEGYDMGVPFFPWFTNAGKAESRRDVLAQTDAVRVASCWGGMVAFEAKWFQNHASASAPVPDLTPVAGTLTPTQREDGPVTTNNTTSSLRFRSETDTYWDASECCLIHADLMAKDTPSLPDGETGIYMNPFIRVAYSGSVLSWLTFTRRFERLYTPIHRIINWIGGRPSFNPRQFHKPGEEVVDRVWVWDTKSTEVIHAGRLTSPDQLHGQFEEVRRAALPGGYCGMRKLLYINEHPAPGEAKWGADKMPLGSI